MVANSAIRKNKVAIPLVLQLIKLGYRQGVIAKRLGVSHTAIWKILDALKHSGAIIQTKSRPSRYVIVSSKKEAAAVSSVLDDDCNCVPTKDNLFRVVEPHGFGGQFEYCGVSRGFGPEKEFWLGKSQIQRIWKEGQFTVHIYQNAKSAKGKLVVWVKQFRGLTLEEQIANGKTDLQARALRLAGEQGLTDLRFVKWRGLSEFNTPKGADLGYSVLDALKLRQNPIEVMNTKLSVSSSHPDQVHLQDIVPLSARELARLWEESLRADLPKRMGVAEEMAIKHDKDLKALMDASARQMDILARIDAAMAMPKLKPDWRDRV